MMTYPDTTWISQADVAAFPGYLHDAVAELVTTAIKSCRLRPGSRLPAEQELAASLGMNRLTVRRGYAVLKEQGLIHQRRGSGTYVTADALMRLGVKRKFPLRAVAFAHESKLMHRAGGASLYTVFRGLEGITAGFSSQRVRVCHVPLIEERLREPGYLDNELVGYDAVILQGSLGRQAPEAWDDWRRRNGRPLVVVMLDAMLHGVPVISYDRQKATYLAAEHLAHCGARRIAYFGRLGRGVYTPKFAGFADAMRDHGLDLLARFQIDIGHQPGQAFAAAQCLLQDPVPPDAIFADTDLKASEVLQAAQAMGVRVPDDLQVVGFDDMPGSELFEPPLTTVCTPRRAIGEEAAALLLNWSEDTPAETRHLEALLVIRQSTMIKNNAELPLAVDLERLHENRS